MNVEILEVFAEAAHLGKQKPLLRPRLSLDELRGFAWRSKNAWCRRQVRQQKRMRYVPVFLIVPAPVERRACGKCGALTELRAGMSRWQHLTPYGVCR
jgi:hypothetical protein